MAKQKPLSETQRRALEELEKLGPAGRLVVDGFSHTGLMDGDRPVYYPSVASPTIKALFHKGAIVRIPGQHRWSAEADRLGVGAFMLPPKS